MHSTRMGQKILLRRIAITFLLLFGPRPPVFCAQDKNTVSIYLYEYGAKYYRDGDVASAEHELRKALLANPSNSAARDLLHKILLEQQLQNEQVVLLERDVQIAKLKAQLSGLQGVLLAYQAQLKASQGTLAVQPKLTSGPSLKAQEVPPVPLGDKKVMKEVSVSLEDTKTRELEKQVSALVEKIALYQAQLSALKQTPEVLSPQKDVSASKPSILLQPESVLTENSDKVRAYIMDKETKLAQLNSQLKGLQRENLVYQAQLDAFEKIASRQNSNLQSVNKKFMQRDEELQELKEDYMSNIEKTDDAIGEKEAQIEELQSEREAMRKAQRRLQSAHIAKIDALLKEIEEVAPEVCRQQKYPNALGPSTALSESGLGRIEQLMREIEKVIPELRK